MHVLAELDTHRDLLGAALDVHVFHAFNRLGLIMKRLTAVPSCVAQVADDKPQGVQPSPTGVCPQCLVRSAMALAQF